MKDKSCWNLRLWEVIIAPSIPKKLVSIPHALPGVWACKSMHMYIKKQHFKVFQLPPAPLWYLLSWDIFNIPCSLLFIIDLLSSLFSQKLRMKVLTNTRIKKPVLCMRPDFEKKMYSRKDSAVGKERTCPSPWLKPLPVLSSLQLRQLTSILLYLLFVYERNKARVQFSGPDLKITDKSSKLCDLLAAPLFCALHRKCSMLSTSTVTDYLKACNSIWACSLPLDPDQTFWSGSVRLRVGLNAIHLCLPEAVFPKDTDTVSDSHWNDNPVHSCSVSQSIDSLC